MGFGNDKLMKKQKRNRFIELVVPEGRGRCGMGESGKRTKKHNRGK